MERHEVAIVGGGPAGAAAALCIARADPELARRTVLLDRAVFPRDKLCGGGIVREADRLLARLGVDPEVASVSIDAIRAESASGPFEHHGPGLFRVVRRLAFDHALLGAVKKAGVAVLEGEAVTHLVREPSGVRVTTRDGERFARVVIGADGAKSAVRRDLVGPARGEPMVALETYTEGYDDDEAHVARFDFRPVEVGLRGYAWAFPSLAGRRRLMNRGIGGSRWPDRTSLRALLDAALVVQGVDPARCRVQGWSAPAWSPDSPQGAPHALLAGDAVGVDPWLGEGITTALGGGMLAANAALEGLSRGDLDFGHHAERLRESAVGWQLGRSAERADAFYAAAARPGGIESLLGSGAFA